MRRYAVAVLFLLGLTAGAWAWEFGGYRSFEADPVATGQRLSHAELAFLKQNWDLAGPSGFSFLIRKDSDHWMGVSRGNGLYLWHIHDGSVLFDFRAAVNPYTGAVTVIRGVSWVGHSRAADAWHAVELAKGYLDRLRSSHDVFQLPSRAKKKSGAGRVNAVPQTASKVKAPTGKEKVPPVRFETHS
ncbi:MAG: hypothetical protein HKM06_01765 [Spirochaetales bacterium]|nr:hypothetical protein [Spirochaetales bacterium]